MTWPITWDSLRTYRQRAPCGCRYTTINVGKVINIKISPNRMQRCFRHMDALPEQIGKELLKPLSGAWDA